MPDQGTKVRYGSEAQSRFTRTPIDFSSGDEIINFLGSLFGLYPTSGIAPSDPSGRYSDTSKKIRVNVANRTPYSKATATVGHEDIHALLDKFGLLDNPPKLEDTLPVEKAAWGMYQNMRMGDPPKELPAYVGSSPFYLGKDFTEHDRQAYINQLTSNLPAKVAEMYRRLAANYTGALLSPWGGEVSAGQ